MTTPVLQAMIYDAPLVNPNPQGLYAAATWTETSGPTRFYGEGVRIRPWNYGGENAFGVWDADWCAGPGERDSDLKTGTRPDLDTEPFPPMTVWAYDECDLTRASQAEVRSRAQQVLRLQEQTAVETEFATRLLNDADVIASRGSLAEAVGYLEGLLAITNTVGAIHVGAQWASIGGPDVILSSGTALRSQLGHKFVFGGGYVAGLGDVLVATSPVFGWRDAVVLRDVIDQQHNVYAAIAERTVVVGYEKLIGAVQIAGNSA